MRRQIKRDRLSSRENMAMTYRLIFSTVIPIILSQTVYQLSGIIDVTLFNALMDEKGHSGTTVSTQLGIYSTKYRILTNVPIAISTAMASSMVPGLVSSYMRQNLKEVRSKISVAGIVPALTGRIIMQFITSTGISRINARSTL